MNGATSETSICPICGGLMWPTDTACSPTCESDFIEESITDGEGEE